jgi:hypothetical protein
LAQIWPLVSFYKKLLQLCWHNSGCTLRSIWASGDNGGPCQKMMVQTWPVYWTQRENI